MSEQRRIRRAKSRTTQQCFSKLGDMLTSFYNFLEKQPKPSDQEVRDMFVKKNKEWKSYCALHKLNKRASLLFNDEVARSWQTRYAKKEEAQN